MKKFDFADLVLVLVAVVLVVIQVAVLVEIFSAPAIIDTASTPNEFNYDID